MPLIPRPNYNQIFASQAPDQDKPAVFNNYPLGWGVESRPNNGKPTIKGFNYLQQTSDLKDLWILQNGAALPYDATMEYAEGAVVVKDGELQQWKGGAWVNVGARKASDIVDASGKTQQEINDLLRDGLFFVEDWGAKGDGVTVDSVAINNAITELSNQFKVDNKPKLLQLKANKVYVVHNIELKAGVSLACVNGFARLLREPNSLGESESTMTWRRIIQTAPSSWVTDSDFECRVFIRNIIFDGNYNNVGWTFGTYNQEQASCLTLYGRTTVDAAWKRPRFDLSNLLFVNSVSDGLHVVNDVDVTFNNLYAERCFRGGLVITGGNSIVHGVGMVSNDARTDIEIDSRGFGNTFKSYVYISDFYQDVGYTKTRLFYGGFDLGTVGGGDLHLNNVNVHSETLSCYFARSVNEIPNKYLIENSVFHVTAGTMYTPTECTFRNTKFVFRNDVSASAGLIIYGAFGSYTQDSEVELLFDSCDFELFDKTIARTSPNITVVSQNRGTKTWVKFINCDLSNAASTSYDFWGAIGGKIWVEGCTVASTSFIGGAGVTNGYPLKLKVGANTYLPTVQKFMSLSYSEASQADNSVEFTTHCEIPQSINAFNIFTGQTQVPPIRIGRRVIKGDVAPTATTNGYNGDIYEIKDKVSGKPFRWVCVSPKVALSAAVWRVTDSCVGSFATADLPVLTAMDIGTRNFDTTTSTFKTWSGLAWV